jgi:hypothetical protein
MSEAPPSVPSISAREFSGHALKSLFASLAICGIGLLAAFALHTNFAGPTAAGYAARHGLERAVIPAGQLDFSGLKLTCGRTATVFDPAFEDYGAAFFGFIILNPIRFRNVSPVILRFAFAHECGHQSVGYSETEADCYAVRLGREQGWLGDRALEKICSFFSTSKGSSHHLPGPLRCEAIRRCYHRAGDAPHS